MNAAVIDATALYAEGHRIGSAIVCQHGLVKAEQVLWMLHHRERPMDDTAGEYAHGIIDALEGAIRECSTVADLGQGKSHLEFWLKHSR